MDEWKARIAELQARLNPSPAAQEQAQQFRKEADESHEAAHGSASQSKDFRPSPDLRSLFREVAKRIHPDFAKDDADRQRRTGLMAQANEAYSRGDLDTLKIILNDYHESRESVRGEGVGAELIRIIRQIHVARKNIIALDEELDRLASGELSRLKRDNEIAEAEGRDLLAELAATIEGKIIQRRKEHESLAKEVIAHGR